MVKCVVAKRGTIVKLPRPLEEQVTYIFLVPGKVKTRHRNCSSRVHHTGSMRTLARAKVDDGFYFQLIV